MLSPKLLLILLLFAAIYCAEAKESQKPDLSGSQNIINQTPAYFIENKGQWDDAIKFRANLNGTTAFICKNNVVFDFYRLYNEPTDVKNEDNRRIEGHVVNLDYSASARQDFKGLKKLDYFHNYFIGNDSTKWARHVALYQEVIVENFSEGIDALFYFENNMLRYDFIVKPGANLHDLSLKFDMGKGYDNSLFVNECGELVMKTSLGDIINGQLAAYQLAGVVKRPVDCAFNVETNNQASFVLGEFDRNEELVIDPLVWSGFLCSEGEQVGLCVKADISDLDIPAEEGAFVCGYTTYTDFPRTTGAYSCSSCGGEDCFISKINASGYPNSQPDYLAYSTFFGGSSDDKAQDMCIYQLMSGAWGIYITGRTSSTDFPIPMEGIFQNTNAGGLDAFITIFSPTLGNLISSTYLGGTDDDEGTGIKVYQGLNKVPGSPTYNLKSIIVLVGNTKSTNFPQNNGTGLIGQGNGFIAYIDSNLSTGYSGRYINGTTMTYPQGLKFLGLDIDPDFTTSYYVGEEYINVKGEFYAIGLTDCPYNIQGEDYTNHRIGNTFTGNDCIIVKSQRFNTGYDVDDRILLTGTYRIGGTDNESGNSIKFSHIPGSYDKYLFLTGYTNSLDFAGGSLDTVSLLTSSRGTQDAFIARLHADNPLNSPIIKLYGNIDCTTSGNSIAVGSYNGSTDVNNWTVNITGTLSTTNSIKIIPVQNEIDGSLGYKGGNDAFVARFPYDLGSISYHEYFGGSNNDVGLSLDMNNYSEIFFTGSTQSSDFPITYNSYNPKNSSSSDNCFVSKISGLDNNTSDCEPTLISPDNISCVNPSQDIDFYVNFNWSGCLNPGDPKSIEIQISANSSFTDPMRFEYDYNNTVDNLYKGIYTVNHESPLLVGINLLSNNTTYYWRALAFSPQTSINVSGFRSFICNDITTQSITLYAEPVWNMISSNHYFKKTDVVDIMSSVVSDLIIMKNNAGDFYEPSFSINNIGNWDYTQGYLVYMDDSSSQYNLSIDGCLIDPITTSISLNSGWSMIPYLRTSAEFLSIALSSISGQLFMVKNGAGLIYCPYYGIYQFTIQNPGQGYQIYMNYSGILTYPSNRVISVVEDDISPYPQYLIPATNKTGNNASILLNCSNIPDNFEIGIWSSNWVLIGSGRINNGVTGITIWGDNEATDAIDGALPFESLNIKAFDYQTGQLIDVNLSNLHEMIRDTNPTNLYYEKNAIFQATAQVNVPNTQTYFNLTCLPNPFQGSTTISYNLPDDGTVTLIITDNLGNSVENLLYNESQNSGSHSVTLNATNIQTGVYYCTLTSGEHTETIQLLIVQ